MKAGGSQLLVRIADFVIALAGRDPGLVRIRGAAARFVVPETDPDIMIGVGWGDLESEPSGDTLFDSGGPWRLDADDRGYRFSFTSPALGTRPYMMASFTRDFDSGEIRLHRPFFPPGRGAYPLEYPLDELLVLGRLAQGGGAEVHACGVVDASGSGLLFVGQSGAGKTTMARLWEKKGCRILSDDRIVLRRAGNRIWMYGTPWHGEAGLADPGGAPLTRAFYLRHGRKNELASVPEAEAVARLFACSFPPFYSPRGLELTLEFFDRVAAAVPCHELRFTPEPRAVEFVGGATA